MADKSYQDSLFDSFLRPPCAQQPYETMQHYSSYSMPVMTTTSYNMQCDFMYGNRNTPTSFLNYPDQLDSANWVPDPRAVADIERGLKYADKMEAIEITSKDLSPASCCSNIDLLIPDFYKGAVANKDWGSKGDSQWFCNVNCGGGGSTGVNQKQVDYPSCSQVSASSNFMAVEEKSRYFGATQKSSEFDNVMLKTFTSYNSTTNSMQCLQNSGDKPCTNQTQADGMLSTDNLLFCPYENNNKEAHLFNLTDFYPQSAASLCNGSLTFPDINSTDQPTGEVSNDESDIIVEESDDEVTDCSEDLERRYDYSTNCIVCNILYTPIGSQFYILTAESPLTMSTQQPVHSKLAEIVGNLDTKRNYLCSQCLSLVNMIDHLQLKLETTKLELYSKYEKTCKENNVSFIVPAPSTVNMSDTHGPHTRNKPARKFRSFCGLHSFKCKLCKQLFSIKKLYENHMRGHKSKNRFLCELCGQRFTKLGQFQLHLKQHGRRRPPKNQLTLKTPKTIPAFSCKACHKLFRTKTNLVEHENYCLGTLPYKCKHAACDKKFATATKLKNHTKLKHDKKFAAICSICNIGFVKLSDYKSHKVTHSTDKKFNCGKCDKSYKTIGNLNYHMKFHDEKLPFICVICSKGFMRKEYLESHVNNHKGIKNFSCQFCSKKFVSQKNLDAHVKYHEGSVKKKTCSTCNKTITTSFEEHLRTHSNLKEFECEVCQMKFNTKSALAKHRKKKHSTKT